MTMNRRTFLHNLGLLPAAAVLPAIDGAQAAPVVTRTLCPMAWDKFYRFAKGASTYYVNDPISMLPLSKRFMERHPIWFKPEYMMTGSGSLTNESSGKACVTACSRTLRTEAQLIAPLYGNALLKAIQDTKSTGDKALFGKALIDLVDKAVDEVNEEWVKTQKRYPGVIICPYVPLQSIRWERHNYHMTLGFKTRYGLLNTKEQRVLV
jgi:hypothetical protein